MLTVRCPMPDLANGWWPDADELGVGIERSFCTKGQRRRYRPGIIAVTIVVMCVAFNNLEFIQKTKIDQKIPNDPLLKDQWYIFPSNHKLGEVGGIDAIKAWGMISPQSPITIAIFDAGMNYRHPDLEANIWTNTQETINGIDDDNNGYIDDIHGWDFVSGDNVPLSLREEKFPDQFDHGTAVAGLIAAVPDNGIGIAGIGRNVKVMPLRVVGAPDVKGGYHAGPRVTFPAAIRYAIRNGAKVIVCTTPLNSASPFRELIGPPLKETLESGVLFVRSAGNAGRNIDESDEYELLSRFPNILVVGGTIRNGTLSPRMNYGMRAKIASPCVDMVFPSFDGYDRSVGPGTSFAAPIVAAVAATLLSQHPELSPERIIAKLRVEANAINGMSGKIDGGRLDMAKVFSP